MSACRNILLLVSFSFPVMCLLSVLTPLSTLDVTNITTSSNITNNGAAQSENMFDPIKPITLEYGNDEVWAATDDDVGWEAAHNMDT